MAKKALLIGCNYSGTKAELRGCNNDVERMRRCLINNYEFSEENIVMLIDKDPSFSQPTGKNILSELSSLVDKAMPGDVLFVHYSGHGTRLVVNNTEDDTDFIQCIVPTDFNLITDYDFRKIVDRVPRDCLITIVADSCHSGGLIKAAKEQIGGDTKKDGSWFGIMFETIVSLFRTKHIESHAILGDYYSFVKNRSLPVSTLIDILKLKTGKDDIDEGNLVPTLCDMFEEDAFMKFGLNNLQHGGDGGILEIVDKQGGYSRSTKSSIPDRGILLSASQSDQVATEVSFSRNPNEVFGVFSNAIVAIIEETRGVVTNRELVLKTTKKLKSQHFTQKPGLYCSDCHVDAQFVCDLIEKQVIDLTKMDGLVTGVAEIGKLEEEKEGLGAEIDDIKSLNQQVIDLAKMRALVTGLADAQKTEEEKEGLHEQSIDESFADAPEQLKVLNPGICTEGEGSCCCVENRDIIDVIPAPTTLAA